MREKIHRLVPSLLGGVCRGLGEYSNVPAFMWRILFIFGYFTPYFPSFIIYLILWIYLPEKIIKIKND